MSPKFGNILGSFGLTTLAQPFIFHNLCIIFQYIYVICMNKGSHYSQVANMCLFQVFCHLLEQNHANEGQETAKMGLRIRRRVVHSIKWPSSGFSPPTPSSDSHHNRIQKAAKRILRKQQFTPSLVNQVPLLQEASLGTRNV